MSVSTAPLAESGPPSIAAQAAALGASPLTPGAAGTCWFHSQTPHVQDREVFRRLGGSIGACSPARALTLPQSNSEAHACECTAPPASSDAFGLHFLEIGANDGVFLSNSLFFETQMAWRGLCVEASPATFRALARNRPLCVNVNGVIDAAGAPRTFYTFEAPGGPGAWESAVSCMEGSVSCPDEAAARRAWAGLPGTVFLKDVVPGFALSALFAAQGWAEFGWLSVDVEGSEDAVFATVDLRAARARFVSYEGTHAGAAAVLARAGYVRDGSVGIDALYVPGPTAWAPPSQPPAGGAAATVST